MSMDRRDVLRALSAFSGLALLSGCKGLEGSSALKGGDSFFSRDEMRFLATLADTIIPTTATPGATEAKVPDTLQSLLTHWANDDTRGRWRTNLELIKAKLEKSGPFDQASAATRGERLLAIDTAVFAKPDHPLAGYRDIKSTIGQAYYLSEAGATKELRYEPVPGDWRGDVPVDRTWAVMGS